MSPRTKRFKPIHLAILMAYALAPLAHAEERQLSTVEVKGAPQGKLQAKLRDEIIKTESISEADIRKTNAATLNEAVDNNPGVSVQTECSICNVRNITLNNLPGRFTTVMIDGVPIFSSVSSAYGLDMIGINGVERIDISRGAGTSLIAPEALAGSVNIVSRRPAKAESLVEAQAGQYGYRRLDGFLARPFAGGAFTAALNVNHHDSIDSNGNGVGEYTGYERTLGGFGLFLDDAGGFKLRGRLDLVDESRGGGALGKDYGNIKASMSGNPFDWSAGKNGSPSSAGWVVPGGVAQAGDITLADGRILRPYDGGRGGMSEIIETRRQQAILVGERKLAGGARLKLAFGYANHDQDSFYEGDYYFARQNQHYSEASLQNPFGATLLTAGLNYRYEDLESHGRLADGTAVNGLDNYIYKTPGVYVQAYRALFEDRLELNGSLRYDRHNVFGGITSPRVNALWHHSAETSSRFAIGRGFRAPTSFFEQDHGILATTRIERHIDNPEISDNASYAFSHAGDRDALVVSVNYNQIKNYALLDSGATDPVSGAPITVFTQSSEPVIVKGIDASYTWRFTSNLEGTLGAEKFSYQFRPGDLSFARPEERVYLRLDYDAGGWDILARATWTGPMDLKRFYDYANNPRYNLDGTPKLDKSPSYWVMDISGRYKVNKTASLVLGVNNLFDFRQTDREDFLWVDSAGNYDVTHFWGPTRGRQVYAGVRLDL
ncbi:MAG: TonB-dependent receptor [Nitrosomonadales bacterium]|nr:MAG: TonB-dependent receptor [Nitrosomonadales bacterium]